MGAILSMDPVQQRILSTGSKSGAGTSSGKVTWLSLELLRSEIMLRKRRRAAAEI